MLGWKHLALLATVCLHCACAESTPYKIPGFVEVCYRDDPKIADCIGRNIATIPTILTEDNSYVKKQQYDPLDPCEFENIPFIFDASLAAGKMLLESGTLRGLSSIQMLSVRPKVDDPKKFILDFDTYFPHANLKTNYRLIGHVIQIPVNIKGRVDLYFEDVKARFHMAGDAVMRDGKEYLNLTSFTWDWYGLKNVRLENNDVVDGYQALNIVVKNLVSSSWGQLFKFMAPPLTNSSAPFIQERLQNHFNKYPYDVILPETRKGSRYEKYPFKS